MEASDSILESVRKYIGGEVDDDFFDPNILIPMNSAFMTLWQLGVGPKDRPFRVNGTDSKWTDFIAEGAAEAVYDYICIKAKLGFDPPASSTLVEMMKQQAAEIESRLIYQTEIPSLQVE